MSYAGLPARLADVRARLDRAAERSGRSGSAVTLVAVTKTHPLEAVEAARAAGLTDLGENRVQELEEKVEAAGRDAVRWHLIGSLQRNKAKRAVRLFDLMHSLDSVRLAEKLSEEAAAAGLEVRALVQVNVSGEGSKSGFGAEELVDALGVMSALPSLRIEGLMTMAPLTEEEGILRSTFAATRRLQEEAARQLPAYRGTHLSMGMTNDYEIAVEEGSTMVRLGTALFGERER